MIKRLDAHIINQIAAGEVIESPFAVIKELVENSIDAGATQIEVGIRNGGKSFISVKDNGSGMTKEDLPLALERHATSKLKDLFYITTLGFRGEALASIASVSRLSISSKTQQSDAWRIEVHGGKRIYNGPHHGLEGTHIEINDLFFATPARLKFLKSDQQEQMKCIQMIKKIALAHPHIGFKFFNDDKLKFHFPIASSQEARITTIFQEDFRNNAIPIHYTCERLKIHGMISPPTLNLAQSHEQYVFVNQRFIKDKLLHTAIKLAYGDTVPHNRYPSVCLFISIDPNDIDVNVHPTKTEIRFCEPTYVKDHLMKAIHKHIQHKTVSTHVLDNLISFPSTQPRVYENYAPRASAPMLSPSFHPTPIEAKVQSAESHVIPFPILESPPMQHTPFGQARLQIFKMFILAERDQDMLLIDQHAAHERVLYERYKKSFKITEKQILLIPEIISVSEEVLSFIKEHGSLLKQTHIECEPFGQSEMIIQAVPSFFSHKNIKQMMLDFITHVLEYEQDFSMQGFIHAILATMACHDAIKAGQPLNLIEMQHLLTEMSETDNIAQCNHGRPTHVMIEKKSLEKMFLRI